MVHECRTSNGETLFGVVVRAVVDVSGSEDYQKTMCGRQIESMQRLLRISITVRTPVTIEGCVGRGRFFHIHWLVI